jgi:hypothetical protein
MTKSLHNTDQNGASKNVPDIEFFGGDLFKLLSKASSEKEGWMKSTKAMEVKGGCLVQVTTQQRNPDGSYSLAEALAFVPGVEICCDIRMDEATDEQEIAGRRLVPIGSAQDSF